MSKFFFALELFLCIAVSQPSLQQMTVMTPVSLLPGSLRIASLHLSLQTQTLIAQGLSSSSVCLFFPIKISFDNQSITNKSYSIAFDETSSSTSQNRVVGILLGSAVPTALVGTSDTAFYDHYSQLATVEANWDLPTLGRYDVGANVFSFVAQQTGDAIRALTSPSLSQTLLDASYPGIFNSAKTAPLPIPNTTLVVNGRPVLPAIVQTWGSAALQACTVYNGSLGVPSAKNPPVLPKGC